MQKISLICIALLIIACSDSNQEEVVELSAKEKLVEWERQGQVLQSHID